MKILKQLTLIACASGILSAALFTSPAHAEPCMIEKNKWGFWVGDCLSVQALGKQELVAVIIEPPIPVFMPDLYADDGDYVVYGTTVEIEVRTGNIGTIASRDFDVTAHVTITGGGMSAQTVSITGRVNGQALGTRQKTTLGVITIPDRMNDYDLETVFTVDSADFPNGGEIRELDETNNVFDDGICRVFGANPDLTVHSCF